MLTVSEAAGGAELHLKKRQSGTADSLAQAALLLQKRLRCSEDVFGKTCWSHGMKDYMRKINRPVQNTHFSRICFIFPRQIAVRAVTHTYTHTIFTQNNLLAHLGCLSLPAPNETCFFFFLKPCTVAISTKENV